MITGRRIGRVCARLGLGLCLAAAVQPAVAQEESPELPGRGVTADQRLTDAQRTFTKGKGPGRGNSFLLRYEEDWSFLRDPALATDWFDRFKYVPLDAEGDSYLSLNAESRFRFDYVNPRNFGIAGSATVPTARNPRPTYTPASFVNGAEFYKQRYMVGADLHLGRNFRLYGELYNAQQTGRNQGPTIPGNQRNDLAIENMFGELFDVTDTSKTGLRLGRQEIFFGNNLNVRANVSTNIPTPVFDGGRAFRDWIDGRLDLFYFNLVTFQTGKLRDIDHPGTNLYGAYLIQDLPRFAVAGEDVRTTLDAFWLGWRSVPFANGNGSGFYNARALITGTRITGATSAGFLSGNDYRHTLGLRWYGGAGNLDWDWQGALQAGTFDGYDVQAFAFNTDTGWTFHGVPWKPRLGTHVDGASGGASQRTRTLQTFQPMYANTQYYGPNNQIAPTNFYDVAPRIAVRPADNVTSEFYWAWYWRYSTADAVYIGAPWPGGNGANNYAVTTLSRGGYTGSQADWRVTWTVMPHVLILAEAGMFFPGSALRQAGARDTTFLNFNLTLKF